MSNDNAPTISQLGFSNRGDHNQSGDNDHNDSVDEDGDKEDYGENNSDEENDILKNVELI
jgi:hypothetical protein